MNPKDKCGLKKPQMHLIPYYVMVGVAKAMLHGGLKYGFWNWRKKKIQFSQYYGANQRHMGAWFNREDFDPESALHHIDHCIASNIVLRDAILNNMFIDDRP